MLTQQQLKEIENAHLTINPRENQNKKYKREIRKELRNKFRPTKRLLKILVHLEM
ncbi:hypothetical protein Q5E69_019275 (plasmid) [Acinetobacter baumannii]